MLGNIIKSSLGKASELGVSLYEDTAPLQLWEDPSLEDLELIIKGIYRQVLGNAYVMESERLIVPESRLKNGEITVREFVRQLAYSDLYRSRFFENCNRYRAIELNFKHLLGRAPESYDEMKYHSEILDKGGYEAEIDAYLDSNEYRDAFGEYVVPYYRGYRTQAGKKMVGFPYLFQLLRGASSSDKDVIQGSRSRLNRALLTNSSQGVNPPSGYGTYGGLTDINQLLAEVLKPQVPSQPTQSATNYQANEEYQALLRQYKEQAATIKQLQSQLSELNAVASIGTWETTKWQANGASSSSTGDPSPVTQTILSSEPATNASGLQQQIQEQEKAIASLQSRMAQLRSLASIGEARLNKWRSRTFY